MHGPNWVVAFALSWREVQLHELHLRATISVGGSFQVGQFKDCFPLNCTFNEAVGWRETQSGRCLAVTQASPARVRKLSHLECRNHRHQNFGGTLCTGASDHERPVFAAAQAAYAHQ